MSLLGPENQESFASVQQQAEKNIKDLNQERKNIKKSMRFWIPFWMIVLVSWVIFFILNKG